MELSRKRREETGAFYTPKVWADLAVQYIARVVGAENMKDYFFWDMACGEGALLDALVDFGVPPENIYGTTLERGDWEILRWSKPYSTSVFDFLDWDIDRLALIKGNADRMIVFTNPPFMNLPSTNNCFAKRTYKCNDATMLFFYRIFLEVMPFMVCSFMKQATWQTDSLVGKRQELGFMDNLIRINGADMVFLSPSCHWDGLSSGWAVNFSMFWCSDTAYKWFKKYGGSCNHFDIDFTRKSDFDVLERFKGNYVIGAAYELENGKPTEILVDNYDAENNCMVQSYGKRFYHKHVRRLSELASEEIQEKADLLAQKAKQSKKSNKTKKPQLQPLFALNDQIKQPPKPKPPRKVATQPLQQLPPPPELFF